MSNLVSMKIHLIIIYLYLLKIKLMNIFQILNKEQRVMKIHNIFKREMIYFIDKE